MNANTQQIKLTSAAYKSGKTTYAVVQADIGFKDLAPATQLPYFSVTGSIYAAKKDGTKRTSRSGNHMYIGGGCIHKDIAKHFPEHAELIRWRLVDANGVPMHYVANSVYHLKNGNIEGFKSCCLFDEAIDVMPELIVADAWLRARLPRLQDEFYACLTKFGFDVDGLRKGI